MINFIWLILMAGGIFFAALNNQIENITQAAIYGAQEAVSLSFKLVGVMCLWLGLVKIAEEAGLVGLVGKLLGPVVRVLFPSVPRNHPAMGAIIVTLTANMLGLGNAVTPLGIRAMQELQTLNPNKSTATPAMCTLLALCTAGFTLVPATIIAIRTAAGSVNPAGIIGTTLVVSFIAMLAVITADKVCQRLFARR